MSEHTNIKTTVTLPADIHWALKKRAAELRLSDKQAITEAIRVWTSDEVTLATLTPSQDRAVMATFIRLMTSNDVQKKNVLGFLKDWEKENPPKEKFETAAPSTKRRSGGK